MCKACGRSFTTGRKTAQQRARFADDVVAEAVRLYVQSLSSYRVLSVLLERRLGVGVGRSTLNRWVDHLGGLAKTPLEVSSELHPAWGGILGVDGKVVWAGGKRWALLVAVDHPTQDLVNALLVPWETPEAFVNLISEVVRDASYPLRGIVSDLRIGFWRAWEDHFGRVPLQACRVHFDRRLDTDIPKHKRSPKGPVAAEFKARLRAILYAPTEEEAASLLRSLQGDRERYRGLGRINLVRSIERFFGLYMTFHRHPELPADNNVTENVIKQLGKKLRLMEGFANVASAERFLRLLIGCYRFKRFTDSTNGRNGKCPLELAGVDLVGNDWLTYLLTKSS